MVGRESPDSPRAIRFSPVARDRRRSCSQGPSRRRSALVRLAALVPSGFKSRRRTCASVIPPVDDGSLHREGRGEGPRSNTSPERKRTRFGGPGGRASRSTAKPGTGAWHVVGAGMVGTGTSVTEGDLVRSGTGRHPLRNRASKAHAKRPGADEESERLIVALTPGESQDERRGRSQ